LLIDAQSWSLSKKIQVSTFGDHFPPNLDGQPSRNDFAYDNRAVGRFSTMTCAT